MTNIERALLMAEKAHVNQTYDIFPYMYHIRQVYEVGVELDLPEDMLIACILHDVLEDSYLSYNDIKKAFGVTVAEIVYCVTDELGRNRIERKLKTYPKIRENWRAIIVKICDRIANVRHSKEYSKNKHDMYLKEQCGFEKALNTKSSELEFYWDKLREEF